MADSGTYTDEAIARRIAIAQQLLDQSKPKPMTHWAQGLNELAQGAVGGMMLNRAEGMEKANKEEANRTMMTALGLPAPEPKPAAPGMIDRIASMFGGGKTADAAPIASTPSVGAGPAPDYGGAIASIESGGQKDPYAALGPTTKTGDRAYGKYQVMGDNIGPWSQAALGKTLTPDQFLGDSSAQDAIFKHRFGGYVNQFGNPQDAASAWFTGKPLAQGAGLKDQLGTSGQSYVDKFNSALPPGSPPGGAVPGVAAALAGAPGGLPPAPPTATPAAPPAAPAASAGAFGAVPEAARRQIAVLLSNPRTAPMGQALLTKFIAKEGDYAPMVDPAQRQAAGIPPEDKTPYQVDKQTGKIAPMNTAPTTNVALNTAMKGQEVMATESAKDFQTAQATGRDAAKRVQTWDSLEQASKGFTPGATAPLKLEAKRYLKDLGVIGGEDVPDAEVFRLLQQQLAIHAQPKGQGAVSNFERDMYAKSIANMSMSPEGLSRAIKIGRGLDDFDRNVANIYRSNARKNGGVPNSIEVNEEIDKLGSPLSLADQNFLKQGQKTEAAPAAGAPDQSALEAEMKKRGLLK